MLDSMQNTRVYIRGCGIVCAMGASQPQLAEACRRYVSTPAFLPALAPEDPPIPYFQISPTFSATHDSRLYGLIDYAVTQAIEDASLSGKELSRSAVFCGSTACDISDLEEHYEADLARDPQAMALYRSGFGVLAGYVRDTFHFGGEEYSFNTACSSSANAFMSAAQMIASHRYDHAVVLGVEAANQLSLQGFNTMMLLSPDTCRPFDVRRNGTTLGEAVCAIILSREPPRHSQFGADKPFYFLGGANLCDTKSVTSSNEDVIAEVMRRALNSARLNTKDVDVIKAHGTSTENNDLAESAAMAKVFGDVFGNNVPAFTSLKPYLGHTLGACGVAELGVLLATLREGFIPATPTFETMDPRIKLQPLQRHHEFRQGVIMLNYFGFGGNNSSLLIGNH